MKKKTNLLSVPGGFLESPDDERTSRWHNSDGGLSVLDPQLNCDLESLPCGGGLGDIISDLLGGETEGSDLGGERGSGSDFSSYCSQVHEGDCCWVELGRHGSTLKGAGLGRGKVDQK